LRRRIRVGGSCIASPKSVGQGLDHARSPSTNRDEYLRAHTGVRALPSSALVAAIGTRMRHESFCEVGCEAAARAHDSRRLVAPGASCRDFSK